MFCSINGNIKFPTKNRFLINIIVFYYDSHANRYQLSITPETLWESNVCHERISFHCVYKNGPNFLAIPFRIYCAEMVTLILCARKFIHLWSTQLSRTHIIIHRFIITIVCIYFFCHSFITFFIPLKHNHC
jgi:hypothetical protein